MRIRFVLLLVAITVMTGFAALNWSEFVRPTQISWGWRVSEAPLGLVMLLLLVMSWVGFLVGTTYLETRYQLAAHRNSKALETQRVLADRAEASRFTELRSYMEAQAALAVQRETATSARIENSVQAQQRDLIAAMDRLAARLAPNPNPGDVVDARVIRQDHLTSRS